MCVMCLHVMGVKEKLKGVNYISPQGSTQWKVVEGLLIEKSHLQKQKNKIKEGRGGRKKQKQKHQTPEHCVSSAEDADRKK